MVEVLPNINCTPNDLKGAEERLRTSDRFANWIHLDIADGVFTFAPSWGTPETWRELQMSTKTKLNLEVHIMVEHPERVVQDWIDAGAKRIIVHYEAFPKTEANQHQLRRIAFAGVTERCRHADVESILAINPETTLAMVEEFLPHFDGFQVFAQAHPGPSGQKFLQSVLPKISALRERFPDATIEVDGGINRETAALAVNAGANVLVAGSYIYNASDPKVAYEELRALG